MLEEVLPYTAAAVVVIFILLFLVERVIPLRKPVRTLLGRLIVNGAVTALAFAAAALLVRPAVNALLARGEENPFGLVHIFEMPAWARFIVAFLLMDLSFYYWHLLNHNVPLLWRFHNVHHIDPDLDVSTGFRFHFGEVAFSAGFRVVQVAVIGMSVWTFAIYEIIFQANTLFHHSNIRLPIGLERVLNRVLVTPRMHGIHHSQVRNETNSNYSVVLPWWDWIHRTLRLNIPQSQVKIGIAGYATPDDNRIWSLITMPFRRQRDYWRGADGSEPQRDPSVEGTRRSRLED